MSKNLEVKGITKKMLREAVDQNVFWNDKLAPMSKSKALWLISNNRIEEDDYCSVIATEDDKMVSFIYMFPDLVNRDDGTKNKVYWMIAWWVHPKYEHSVLATYIFNEALNLADRQILIKSYAENVTEFYEKQPFSIIASRLRHTIFFSLDASMLIGRFRFLKSFKFILDPIDNTVAAIFRSMNNRKAKKKTKGLTYNYLSEIDQDAWSFIAPLCNEDLIYKTREYVSWQVSNTQYMQTPVAAKHPHKTLETGLSNNIYIHNLAIRRDEEIIGFLSYIINYNEFNVKYFLVKDDSEYDVCVDAMIENFNKVKTKFIFTDDTRLSDVIRKRYKTIFTHKVIKKGLAHKETTIDFDTVNLLNRDGHFY